MSKFTKAGRLKTVNQTARDEQAKMQKEMQTMQMDAQMEVYRTGVRLDCLRLAISLDKGVTTAEIETTAESFYGFINKV